MHIIILNIFYSIHILLFNHLKKYFHYCSFYYYDILKNLNNNLNIITLLF